MKKECGAECEGYECTLPKGHAGWHLQDTALGAKWPCEDPFDRCECHGKGKCIPCQFIKTKAEFVEIDKELVATNDLFSAALSDYNREHEKIKAVTELVKKLHGRLHMFFSDLGDAYQGDQNLLSADLEELEKALEEGDEDDSEEKT